MLETGAIQFNYPSCTAYLFFKTSSEVALSEIFLRIIGATVFRRRIEQFSRFIAVQTLESD